MHLALLPFTLKIVFDKKSYTFQVTQTYLSETKEIFTLVYGKRSLQMQSNRPLIRGKNLNRKKIEWKAIDGQVKYQSSLETIKEELDGYIKKIERPPFDWASHPKNQPY
ncbi:MAG: hypothetical protein M3139_07375 [Bacteroidota bacterium]|nr:hypothetical protein [Bacteroidota bacterium]